MEEEIKTEEVLKDIFSYVHQKQIEKYEQSEIYKLLQGKSIDAITNIILLKWSNDILSAVHFVEKEHGKNFNMTEIIEKLVKGVKNVEADHKDFLRRHGFKNNIEE